MKLVKFCTAALLLVPAVSFAASPFNGTWTFSAQHIQLTKKPMVLVLNNGEFSCKTCWDPKAIKADGMEQKIKGNPNADSATITVVDANTVTGTYKLDGKPVDAVKIVVAADGKSMTRDDTLTYGADPTFYVERYTRVGDAPAGAHAVSGSWRESKIISASGPGVMVTYGMTDDGFTMSSNGQSYSAKFDEKTYPVKGDPTKTMVNLKKVSDTEVIESDSQKGTVVEVEDMTVAADGKTIHVVDTQTHGNRVSHYDLSKSAKSP
jgi:hypothetical protein